MLVVYYILKGITKFVLRIYYPKTTILNRERLRFSEPTILACSHPNTMMDPLHVAARTKKPVHFLANANLFASTFGNWFYSNFFCIPISRQIDDRKKVNNEHSFSRVSEFLSEGGCLWIAPEGGSYWGRHWMSLKTGTARMALLAEAENDFNLGLRILPIGLNYEAPNYFGTKIVINVGAPMEIKTYKEAYAKGFRNAAKILTEDLEERLKELEISPSDEEEDSILEKVEIVLQNELPASNRAEFFRTKAMLKHIQENEPTALKNQIDDYFTTLKDRKISDRAVMQFYRLSKARKWADWLWIVGGFPLFIYGLINSALPSFIPYYFTNSRQPYIGYRATVKMVIGLFTFPIFYTLQTALIHYYFQNDWLTLCYFLSLIPTGLFAWHYFNWSLGVVMRWKINRFTRSLQQQFVSTRKQIVEALIELS